MLVLVMCAALCCSPDVFIPVSLAIDVTALLHGLNGLNALDGGEGGGEGT